MTQDSMPTDRPRPPRAHVAWQLRVQAAACDAMGSPLYAALLANAAADVEDGGPCWDVLGAHVAPGRGDALALRFMAAVHRLVLTGRAPGLARHYPSVGGSPGPGAWEALRALAAAESALLSDLVRLPCQTNEVGRTAALVGGFLAVAARFGLPLRVLEVGASAGLNLRWDRFRYGGGGATWGPIDSPVDLSGHWRIPPPAAGPHARVTTEVVERRGCDLAPVDADTEDGRLALTASVWADQVERLERLAGAVQIAAEVPAEVDRAALEVWTAQQLAHPRPGVATVVYHSIVDEYLPAEARAAFLSALEAAGRLATAAAPLAWLRLEPVSALRSHALALRTWPGGGDEVLATCGAHGTDVVWLDPSGGGERRPDAAEA